MDSLQKKSSPKKSKGAPDVSNQRKKGERYLQQFKRKVVRYSKSHSFKATGHKFGVHVSTVSDWATTSKRDSHVKVTCTKAEQAFYVWLQATNISSPEQVESKLHEIVSEYGENYFSNNCVWLYQWYKKWNSDGGRLIYPATFKLLVVNFAEQTNQSVAARTFNIAHRRVFDWIKNRESLECLVKEGAIKKKPSGRNVTSKETDDEIWKWYQAATVTPTAAEIRTKACELYGDKLKCSYGWYKRWCERHGVKTNHIFDDKIIAWVLEQFDANKTVTHADVQTFALTVVPQNENEFKASAGWAIRFCKRHWKLLQIVPSFDTPLPPLMTAQVDSFRSNICDITARRSFCHNTLGCMDEYYLHLKVNDKPLLRRSGTKNCLATVVLSCLADGTFLPPMLILKGSGTATWQLGMLVTYQSNGQMDADGMKQWLDLWFQHVSAPNLLLVDCYSPHVDKNILNVFEQYSNSHLAIVPGGCTSKLLPLEFGIKPIFHNEIENLLPKCGPSSSKFNVLNKEIVKLVSSAYCHMVQNCEIVKQSFVNTGIIPQANVSI